MGFKVLKRNLIFDILDREKVFVRKIFLIGIAVDTYDADQPDT